MHWLANIKDKEFIDQLQRSNRHAPTVKPVAPIAVVRS
jgi:hypothetical protein